jgi:MFS superfamily sulfate permease-like transporter
MPRLLLLNHVLLLLCCSIYLGTGFSLVFFQFPLEPQLTVDNYQLIFVAPVMAATHFFTYMTILMLICGLIMLATEWLSGLRWVPVLVLVGIVAATALTVWVIIPLNDELAAGVPDPARLKTVFHEWANLNRVRFALWGIQWATMAYWFYRLALKARANR